MSSGSAEALLERLREDYRLAPDGRFIEAIGVVEDVLGATRSEVRVVAAGEGWVVDGIDDAAPRRLGSSPSFAELYALVAERASALASASEHGGVGASELPEPAQGEVADSLELLVELDEQWAAGRQEAGSPWRPVRPATC